MAGKANWDRFGALAGALFCIFAIIGFLATESSGTLQTELSSKTTTISIVTDSDSRVVGAYFVLLSAFFLFIFASYLRRFLQRSEQDDGWLASVSFGGGLVVASMLLFYTGFAVAENVTPTLFGATRVSETLLELNWGPIFMLAPPLAAFVGGATAVGFRFEALPRWVCWLGALITVALLVPYAWYPALLAFFPWLFIVSVVLLFQAESVRSPSDKA